MKKRWIYVLSVFVVFSSFVWVSPTRAGHIVAVNDDWTLSDTGFLNSSDTGTFALNVANWFTGGKPGNFLVYSEHFGLTGPMITTVMTSAGHTWTVDTSLSFNVENLLNYDGVFTGDIDADNQVLIDYVNAGGNVYVFSAGNSWDPDLWYNFLTAFGLQFGEQLSYVGNIPINSSHPIFTGVHNLYTVNGSYIIDLAPSDPRNEILVEFSGGGVYAVYDDSPIPVEIDIKPGSDPNCINISSSGVISVAIFSSDSFDATSINPVTISLAGARVKIVGKSGIYLAHEEDVNEDGLIDLVCQVETAQFMIELGESLAVLEAETFDGLHVRGEDTVRIVPDN